MVFRGRGDIFKDTSLKSYSFFLDKIDPNSLRGGSRKIWIEPLFGLFLKTPIKNSENFQIEEKENKSKNESQIVSSVGNVASVEPGKTCIQKKLHFVCNQTFYFNFKPKKSTENIFVLILYYSLKKLFHF